MNLALWPVLAMLASVPQEQTHGTVCLAIDEAHDTLPAEDRQAALILIAREFEREHLRVVTGECANPYVLSHVRLGNTIRVRLAGGGTEHEGTAIGMDDLPPLYNQLVRAILTGSSVGAMNVVDRTNVTTAQVEVRRMHVDSFGYGRVGYARAVNAARSGSPSIGFGYRAEMDGFALDVSLFNVQLPPSVYGAYGSTHYNAASLLKLEGLHFVNPTANASAYFGGGVSFGMMIAEAHSSTSSASSSSYRSTSWGGSGLQGELSAGYELPRASELRVFFQADATLPFYSLRGQAYEYSGAHPTSVSVPLGHRYNPSFALSVGIGWQRHQQ